MDVHLRKGDILPQKGKQVLEERWVPAKKGVRVSLPKEMHRGAEVYTSSRFLALQGGGMGERIQSEAEEGHVMTDLVVEEQLRGILLPLVTTDHDTQDLEHEGSQ
ncbi:hypothetical protein Dimus_010462 [Dionaea muscipula]